MTAFLTCMPAVIFAQANHTLKQPISLFEKDAVFPADSPKMIFSLGDSLVIPYSESLWADSLLLTRDRDYSIEYLVGEFHLKRPLTNVSFLRVRYKIFPFSLRTSYAHREIVRAEPKTGEPANGDNSGGIVPRKQRPRVGPREEFGAQLIKSGSILRGISVGTNQNLQVDSGLRMQISGRLAQNVEVVASLTDQNTPIQPEGNTQTLQEIDKVFVQIKAPNLQATLGDYDLNLSGTEFTSYNRKLQGVMGQANVNNAAITVSGAVSRGQFNTNEFQGQEGNQGPYQLQGPTGQINLIVLAGTEKVWVDGEP
ncbi:MAG: hypothetical protein ACE5G1_06350, partial [bacterium]